MSRAHHIEEHVVNVGQGFNVPEHAFNIKYERVAENMYRVTYLIKSGKTIH